MTARPYYGKYRGTVLNNIDPMNRARITVQVAAVSSVLPSTWCEPCLPLAGIQSGTYFVPQIGAGVWIEFEQGDPARPVWTGCLWANAAEVPLLALAGVPATPSIVLQTATLNAVMISDLPGPAGGILLTIGPPPGIASLSISTTGIILQSGAASITMTPEGGVAIVAGGASIVAGPAMSVVVNAGGLVVT